ncbi:MAG TPA: hypothetical protein VFN35_30315, partial [Ktedonobacteraceae bacterium]|nr:hypothetical protein [Ktedonobacteraceae bacterium]
MTSILATKLYRPRLRPNVVSRPRLLKRLNEGLYHKLTLISASAGSGKTTLISEWVAGSDRQVAWLSLDEEENDPTHFLAYLIAALQTIVTTIGEGVSGALQSPQPPPSEVILTDLLNDLVTIQDPFVLVLDDYHVLSSQPVDQILGYFIEHLPPPMHLVIATREDPHLPLARLRARDDVTELRAADLRFSPSEASAFLTQAMGLPLSTEDIAALEHRTEGWIAGLQLAALTLQGHQDTASFITTFTGSHQHIVDYLLAEVLEQQDARIQMFLLHTSILDRFCSSLCDAVMLDSSSSGQATLEYLEHTNLFIVPLDNERHWYRYHHLFAELLQQRLRATIASSTGDEKNLVATLHQRASQWYGDQGLELEAFHHAVRANDIERAARLVEGKGMPLHFRGAIIPVFTWLESLPKTVLDARPALWVIYASALTMGGQPIRSVEEKLQAAEAILHNSESDDLTRDLIGHIAAIRAMAATSQHMGETMIAQSLRALEYLHPNNLPVRTSATWTLGLGYQYQRDYAKASQAYMEVLAITQGSGNLMLTIGATICQGQIQEAENQLTLASETYQRALQLAGNPPLPAACEMHLGLARILYEWNDLDAAQKHGQQGLHLARQLVTVDTPAVCQILLARLNLARGDVAGATALVTQADQFVRQQNFLH